MEQIKKIIAAKEPIDSGRLDRSWHQRMVEKKRQQVYQDEQRAMVETTAKICQVFFDMQEIHGRRPRPKGWYEILLRKIREI